MDDKKKEELEREFDEAYRLAMEMVIEKRGGDPSIVYKKLMDNAPNIGMIVVERDAVYEGEPGTLVWDYGLCNEITFIYDDDPEHIAVLYTAKNEYDAERAFNEYYNKMRPEGVPEEMDSAVVSACKRFRNQPILQRDSVRKSEDPQAARALRRFEYEDAF